MSFDDRLRDELRRATESHAIDADAALRRVKTSDPNAPVAVPLVEEDTPRRRVICARRVIGVAAAIALIAGAIALPFALRDTPHNTARRNDPKRTNPDRNAPLINRAALKAVTSALNATTSAGSFHVVYSLTENASTVPTTTVPCPSPPEITHNAQKLETSPITYEPGADYFTCGGGPARNVTTTGYATVNVNPYAMKAVSDVSTFGPVTVRVDDTNYWESAGDDSITTPTGPGSPLSSFASLVESTLGPREGAGAMMGLASPTGYLSITHDAITGATELGAGTIDGKPVTNYRVVVDPALLAKVPGLSAEQTKTITAALAVLQREGFTGNTTDVSVDAAGFIVHTKSTNNFADGGSVVNDDTFSQFGCAGTVDLPGRPVGAQVCTGTAAQP